MSSRLWHSTRALLLQIQGDAAVSRHHEVRWWLKWSRVIRINYSPHLITLLIPHLRKLGLHIPWMNPVNSIWYIEIRLLITIYWTETHRRRSIITVSDAPYSLSLNDWSRLW